MKIFVLTFVNYCKYGQYLGYGNWNFRNRVIIVNQIVITNQIHITWEVVTFCYLFKIEAFVQLHQQEDDEVDSSTMVRYDSGAMDETLKPSQADMTLVSPVDVEYGTLLSNQSMATMTTDLGTMVINSDPEDMEEDSTMKRKILIILSSYTKTEFAINLKLKPLISPEPLRIKIII